MVSLIDYGLESFFGQTSQKITDTGMRTNYPLLSRSENKCKHVLLVVLCKRELFRYRYAVFGLMVLSWSFYRGFVMFSCRSSPFSVENNVGTMADGDTRMFIGLSPRRVPTTSSRFLHPLF